MFSKAKRGKKSLENKAYFILERKDWNFKKKCILCFKTFINL